MEKLFECVMTSLGVAFALSIFGVNNMIKNVCIQYFNFEFSDSLYYLLIVLLGICFGIYESKNRNKDKE